MQPKAKRLVVVAIDLLLLVAAGYYAKRELSIDRCLDNGGSWNYESNECDE